MAEGEGHRAKGTGQVLDAPATSRLRAYNVWRQCGQNITETARVLKRDYNYEISRQSLHAWKKNFDWEAQAARAEAAANGRREDVSDDSLLGGLLVQKKKYEEYFDSQPIGQVDVQATHGYNSVLKMIVDMREKTAGGQVEIDRPKIFLEDMEFVAETLKEIDPAGLKILGKNFDTIVKRFKAQHA